MTGRLQETLEETQRRLALGGVTTAPMMQTRDTAPRPPGNTAGKVVAFVVVLVVAVVAGLAALGASTDDDTDTVTDGAASDPDWSAYPGNAYLDPDAVLAAPALGAVRDESQRLVENVKTDLTAAYGFEWRPYSDQWTSAFPNGYDGDSMLVSYRAPQWQGTVVLDDPAARARILAMVGAWATGSGLDDVSLQNDTSPDDAWARQQYGATDLQDQPLWSAYAPATARSGFSLQYSVLDTNLAADPTFVGGSWFDMDTDAAAGVLHVSLEVFGDALLDDARRDEFARALEPYAGLDRPDPLDLG